jgi:hypothetical protein
MFTPEEFDVNFLYNNVFINLTEIIEKKVEILEDQFSVYDIGNIVLKKLDDEFSFTQVNEESKSVMKIYCATVMNDLIKLGTIRRKAE